MGAGSDRTERIGVNAVESIVLNKLGRKFHNQNESHFGLDAQIEEAINDQPPTNLIWSLVFTEPTAGGGWVCVGDTSGT